MELAIEGGEFGEFGDMDFYISSSSNTTTAITTPTSMEDEIQCEWNNWAPVIDWQLLSDDNNFFMESMMDEGFEEGVQVHESPNSITTTTTATPTTTSSTSDMIEEETSDEDSKGLRLVHLLIAAAEALTGANKCQDLARVILVRLKELVSPTVGSNMERLAAYFADALQGVLEGTGAHAKHPGANHQYSDNHRHHHQSDVLAAFQLLQDMSPYVKFGHFTANQAILEAVAQDRRVHIVDYDIMEGIQWASLMQALVSRKEGLPAPHLRITALTRSGGSGGGRRSIGTVQETGRRLVAFAASIGQPFSFHQCRLDPEENFRPSSLKMVKGEALIVNCMLHLPHFSYRSPDSVASFLSGAAGLGPRLITLVEEEAEAASTGFVGRFLDSLHHYSALYDSLEAGFPMQGRARALVEKVFLGPRIAGSVARSYRAPEGEECSWGNWLAGEGFRPVGFSFFNHCQAKLLLGLFNDGYRVEEVASNKIVLGWKSRSLLSASVWTSSSPSPSQSSARDSGL